MNLDNFPCICGHPKSQHAYRQEYLSPDLQNICWECMREIFDFPDQKTKHYHEFQADNLIYLEQQIYNKVNK